MVGQGWHLIAAFLLYAYLARVLGPTRFGHWTVVLSVLSWVEIVVAAGLVKVATKALTEKPEQASHLSRAAYLGQALTSLVLFAALVIAAEPVAAALGDPRLAPLIRIAALDIPLYAVFMAASAIVLGRQRFVRQGVAWIVYATAKAALIASFVAMGWGIEGALVGNALSSLAGLFAMYAAIGGQREGFSALMPTVRWMTVASLPFVVLALIQGVVQYTDLWIVSATVANARDIGFYASATVLAEIPVFLFLGLNRVIFPSISSARAHCDALLADSYTTQSLRTAVIVTVLAVAFTAAAGRQVIELVYSAEFMSAYVPVVLLMVAGGGRAIHATCAEILMAQERRAAALGLLGLIVVAEVATVAWAAGRFGIDGAAAAAAASMSAGALAAVLLLRVSVGWRLLATMGRALLAAGLVGGALYLTSPSPLVMVVTLPVVAAAYAGLLWLFREFDAQDVAAMRAAVGR